MKNVFIVSAALILLVTSCKKDEGGPSNPVTATRTQLLTRGKWITASSKVTANISGSDTTIDLFSLYPDCQKDDYEIFRSDNHLIADEGLTKCNASSAQQSENGTWTLTNHDSVIVLAGGSPGGNFKIVSLDSNTLKVTTDTTFFIYPAKFNATYTHVD
jgi:hypothetical protein